MLFLYRESVNALLKSADPNLSDEDIDRAVGLLWVNAFACSNGGGQVVKGNKLSFIRRNSGQVFFSSQAIFPTFSFMSHSCAPNCAHSVFPNKTLALQVMVMVMVMVMVICLSKH